ncbi:MAG: phenylalanine--tRNA ligase subunit alpha [Chitinophagaceae bacterium]|nr:phenylalanine--tRNA ligase subunit alpha [Chitinophagaceae bacterium]
MIQQIHILQEEIQGYTISNKEELETYRMRFISRKSVINELFDAFKSLSPEEKKKTGVLLNTLKNKAEERLKYLNTLLEEKNEQESFLGDMTLPSTPNTIGAIHPLSALRKKIVGIFERIGYNQADGPEIETDWYNFSALNFPPHHPAREMQDTFFIDKKNDVLLRTHTSSVQVRLMEKKAPPIRSIMPGRVFRNETITARSHCIFHQVEGIYIDQNVSFADLKQTLYFFAKEMFHTDILIRFRPSFFPFTEPSAEIDISCLLCHGKGCNICKQSGWIEIAGAGMIHPNVLKASHIDHQKYTGFAFGMGIERMALIKYRIKDIRLFTQNDIRFLKQFASLVS